MKGIGRSLTTQASPRLSLQRPLPPHTHTHTRLTAGSQLEEMRKNEDPRLSFSTPEFKEAQRVFTDAFKVYACVLTGGMGKGRTGRVL